MARKRELFYVELKSGYSNNGPAWLGYGTRSKSGVTIYFNGQAFGRSTGGGISGNYFEYGTGDEYWISHVKKNAQDRHWAGNGPVIIDEEAVDEYLQTIGKDTLPRHVKRGKLKPPAPPEGFHERRNEPIG